MTVYCDVDGTLLDSSARHLRLMQDLLGQENCPWPEDAPDYLTYKADGHSTRAWLETAGFSAEKAAELAARWQAQIEDPAYLAMDRPYDDAAPFLQAVRQLPARIVLVSARQNPEALRRTLADCGLLGLVDELVVVPPRHAADEKAARLRPRITPGDCMVGDTEADLQAAQQLGMPCYLLNRGFRSRRYWQQQGQTAEDSLPAVLRAITDPNKED